MPKKFSVQRSTTEIEQLWKESELMGTVYLIHFEKPICHAHHYLGFTDDLLTRLEQHRKGNGSHLMQVVGERGIE